MNTVKVMIRAKLDGKYPYLPAVINSNGRIKPGVAMVGGVEQKVEGSYYLRFTEDGDEFYRVSRAVHFAHPARTECVQDLVGSQPNTRGEWHLAAILHRTRFPSADKGLAQRPDTS